MISDFIGRPSALTWPVRVSSGRDGSGRVKPCYSAKNKKKISVADI
jgi:hypothetical protein